MKISITVMAVVAFVLVLAAVTVDGTKRKQKEGVMKPGDEKPLIGQKESWRPLRADVSGVLRRTLKKRKVCCPWFRVIPVERKKTPVTKTWPGG